LSPILKAVFYYKGGTVNTVFEDLKKKGSNGSEGTHSVFTFVKGAQDTNGRKNGADDDHRLMRHFVRDFIEQQEG